MSDFIDRQDAVNAIYHHFPSMSKHDAEMVLYEVPSAEPHSINLNQGQSSDMISRQALLDAITASINQFGGRYTTDQLNMWGLFSQMITELPSAEPLQPWEVLAAQAVLSPPEPQWIPCSERLPEVAKWVLVSSGDCVVSDSVVVEDGRPIWYMCGTIDIEHDAWCELPEPYKEDKT